MYFEKPCRVFELSISGSQAPPLGRVTMHSCATLISIFQNFVLIFFSFIYDPFSTFSKLTHIQPTHRIVF